MHDGEKTLENQLDAATVQNPFLRNLIWLACERCVIDKASLRKSTWPESLLLLRTFPHQPPTDPDGAHSANELSSNKERDIPQADAGERIRERSRNGDGGGCERGRSREQIG